MGKHFRPPCLQTEQAVCVRNSAGEAGFPFHLQDRLGCGTASLQQLVWTEVKHGG